MKGGGGGGAGRGVWEARWRRRGPAGGPGGGGAPADPIAPVSVKPEPTAAWIKIARLAGDVPPDAPLSPPLSEPSLAGGMTLQRDGDYDAAADIFRAPAQSPDAILAAEANLRLGQALR